MSNITKSLPRLLGAAIAAIAVVVALGAVAGMAVPQTVSSLSSLNLSSGSLPELLAAEAAPVPELPAPPYVPPPYTGNSPYGAQTGPEIPDGFVFPTRITQSEFVQPAALTQLRTCHNNTYETDPAGFTVLHSSCHHDYLAVDVSVVPFQTIVVAPISGTVTIVNNPDICSSDSVPGLSFSSREKRADGKPKYFFYLTHLAPSSVHHYRAADSGPWQVGEQVFAGEQIGIGGPAQPDVPEYNCADGTTTPHVHMDVALVSNAFDRCTKCSPLPMKERMYDPMPMLQYGFSKLPQ